MSTIRVRLHNLGSPGGHGNGSTELGSGTPIAEINIQFNSAEVSSTLVRSAYDAFVAVLAAG